MQNIQSAVVGVLLCMLCIHAALAVVQDLSLGGNEVFASLGNASDTQKTRATGRVGLYCHASAMQVVYDSHQLQAIVDVFKNTGPCHAELPFEVPADSFFEGWYTSVFTKMGLNCSRASVNIPSINSGASINITTWTAYVQAARKSGIHFVAPVYSPNAGNEPLNVPFATDPYYAFVRQLALAGGALTIDSPPNYAFARGNAYLNFIQEEIQWAKANKLRVTYIVSPNSSQNTFLSWTEQLLDLLVKNNTLPHEWACENYQVPAPSGYVNWIGSEGTNNTVSNVAYWLAKNSPALNPPQQ